MRYPVWFDSIVFFSILAVTLLTATPYATFSTATDVVVEYGMFAFGAALLADCLIKQTQLGSLSRVMPMIAPLIALIAFAALQLTPLLIGRRLTADPDGTRQFIYKMCAVCLVLVLLLRHTNSTDRLRVLVYFVMALGLISAVGGLAKEMLQIVQEGSYGQFPNRNHFALLMEMAFGVAAGVLLSRSWRRNLWFISITALSTWAALVLTSSRGGILAMVSEVVLLTALVLLRRSQQVDRPASRVTSARGWHGVRRWRALASNAALITLVASVMLVAVVWVGGERVFRRLESVPGEFHKREDSLHRKARRLEIWSATWGMIKAHPAFGVGLGAYAVVVPDFLIVSDGWEPEAAHNEYLELLASAGIVGAGIGAVFAISLVKLSHEGLSCPDPFRRAACRGAVVGLFGVAVHSVVDYGLHIPVNALVCTILIAIATVKIPNQGRYLTADHS